MKRKSLVLAAILVILIGVATQAAGQSGTSSTTDTSGAGTADQPGSPASPGPAIQPVRSTAAGAAGQPVIPPSLERPDPFLPANITGPIGPSGPVGLPGPTRHQIRPFVTVEEQYTSNVNLVSDGPNKREEWITTIYPGITLISNDARFGADLTYRAGFNFYAHDSERNYVSHDGTLNLRYNPDSRLTFRLRDYLRYSDDPVQSLTGAGQAGYQLTSYAGRQRNLRNVVEPAVDYQFGRDSTVGFYYRNNILRNDSSDYEDSTENYFSPRMTYWFNQRNGIVLEYGYTIGEFSQSTPDLKGHRGYARYNHRLGPMTTFFVDYEFLYRDYDDPGNDYTVNAPTAGIEYAFNPTLTGVAQGGYYLQNPSRTESKDGFKGLLSLTQRDRLTTYAMVLESGYREDLFSTENLGFAQYYRASVIVNHRLMERFTVGLLGIAEYADYTQNPREDWIYTVDATANYQILRWLSVGARAGYRETDSNIPTVSYDEWHVFLNFTVSYDIL